MVCLRAKNGYFFYALFIGYQTLSVARPPLAFFIGPKSKSKFENFYFTYSLPYGIKNHMKGKLIYHEKFIYDDGAIREMVLWQLPNKTSDRPHGLKYRLYYGLSDGTCIVRYDNESGKGNHRHIKGKEKSYPFKDVETLVADFLAEIEKARKG
jgi:hypothetical protein